MVVSVFRLRASKGAEFGGSVVKNVEFAALGLGFLLQNKYFEYKFLVDFQGGLVQVLGPSSDLLYT